MRINARLVLILALVLAVTPALAEKVIILKNGSSLAIVDHWVEDDMIWVDLGENAEMAFPLTQVDRIVEDDRVVPLMESDSTPNRQIPGNNKPRPDSTHRVGSKTSDTRPWRWGGGEVEKSKGNGAVEIGDNGVKGYRPFKGHPSPSRSRTKLTGHQNVYSAGEGNGGDAKTGWTSHPRGMAIDKTSTSTKNTRGLRMVTREPGPPAPPPVENTEDASGSDD